MRADPTPTTPRRARRPLLRVALGLLLLLNFGFVAMYVLGARLPEAHQVALERRIEAAPGRVWALVRDFEGQASWRSDTSSIVALPAEEGQPERYAMMTSFGEVRFIVEGERAPTELVTRIVEHADFGGTWTYRLLDTGDGATSVTIEEDGEVYGTLFRFFGHYVFGFKRTLALFLDDLERAAAGAAQAR